MANESEEAPRKLAEPCVWSEKAGQSGGSAELGLRPQLGDPHDRVMTARGA